MKNLLSICIPTYNRAEIVYECVKNCLNMKEECFDVVVTDNCSTDNTQDMLAMIKDSRFRYFRNETNIGYENFAVSLHNGDGKYCLLLSDEDEIRNINWRNLINTLESDNDVGVYQCEYNDEDGKNLVKGPDKLYKKATYEIYKFIKDKFAFAGGLIVKKEVADAVWESINKNTFLWKLYPQIVLPIYCVRISDCAKLNDFTVSRTKRNNKGTLDVKSWKGNGKEPYWTLSSRKSQNVGFMEIYNEVCSDELTRQKLLFDVCIDAVYEVKNYCINLHDAESVSQPLFQRYIDIVERDLKYSQEDWIRIAEDFVEENEIEAKKLISSIDESAWCDYKERLGIGFDRAKRQISEVYSNI